MSNKVSQKRIWVIEEIDSNGQVGQRQSMSLVNIDQDDNWCWARPDDRLSNSGIGEWNRVMAALKNVHGEDLRHVVCATGLMDHCNNTGNINKYKDMPNP